MADKTRRKQEPDLDKLRDQIQDITKSILDGVAERQKLAIKVAQIKKEKNLSIENLQVEAKLIETVGQYAKHLGIDENLAVSIVSQLIQSSKIAQRKSVYESSLRSYLKENGIRSVSVMGAGRMGGWFARYFQDIADSVTFYDNDTDLAKSKAKEIGCDFSNSFSSIAKSDLVTVAVPISKTPLEIRRLIKEAGERPLRILEITSVKAPIAASGLLDASKLPSNVRLYSIHPLFGALSSQYASNTIIEINSSTSDNFVSNLFPHFRLFRMDWQTHDKLMSLRLSLPHFLAFVFGDLSPQVPKGVPKEATTPSFDHMAQLARRTFSENAGIYFEIQSTNPNNQRLLEEIVKSLTKLQTLIQNEKEFRKFFNDTKESLA